MDKIKTFNFKQAAKGQAVKGKGKREISLVYEKEIDEQQIEERIARLELSIGSFNAQIAFINEQKQAQIDELALLNELRSMISAEDEQEAEAEIQSLQEESE